MTPRIFSLIGSALVGINDMSHLRNREVGVHVDGKRLHSQAWREVLGWPCHYPALQCRAACPRPTRLDLSVEE
jgi:hypothetical protein